MLNENEMVVAKFGGSVSLNPDLEATFVKDAAWLYKTGRKVVIVHGGGKRVSEVMKLLGMEPEFVDGHRVTTRENMVAVQWILSAEANKSLVAGLCSQGVPAVGISGRDASLFKARPMGGKGDYTGQIEKVNPKIVLDLVKAGYVPVISPVSEGKDFQALNINADMAAGELAAAMEAGTLVYVTDVPGVFKTLGKPETMIHNLSPFGAGKLLVSGIFEAGMIPKIQGAMIASIGGVTVRIVGGPQPGALARALQDPSLGTTLAL